MYGRKRDLLVFAIAALLMVSAIAGAVQIAEVRKEQAPHKAVAQAVAWDDGQPAVPARAPRGGVQPDPFAFPDQGGWPPTVTTTRAS